MAKNEAELKKFLENIDREDINFKKHFYDKQELDRNYLSEELVIKSLKDTNNFLGFQDQSKNNVEQYRIGVKISEKYDLVAVFEIKDKVLNIITAWKTSRKWQKAVQK
jgi:hypothetical protein